MTTGRWSANPGTSAAMSAFLIDTDITATSMSLAASAPQPIYGRPVTITATITAVLPGSTTPTGTVTFVDGYTTLGTGRLSTVDGVTTATLTTSSLGVGSNSITATYPGDANFLASASNPLDESVVPNSSIKLAPPGLAVFGQKTTLTATVSALGSSLGAPTGTVTFKDGGATLGTAKLSTAKGVTTATFTTAGLAVGTHTITAVYCGNGKITASVSNAAAETVAKAETTIAAVASPDLWVSGQPVTLTATVSATAPGGGLPTGIVIFKDGKKTLGAGTLSLVKGLPTATLTSKSLAAGSRVVTAIYCGDGNFAGSTSLLLHQTPSVPAVPTIARW